jgi:hexosaminidase
MPLPELLPQPVEAVVGGGIWRLEPQATVSGPPGLVALARMLLGPATGFALAPGGVDAAIRLGVDGDTTDPERYVLRIDDAGLQIIGGGEAGVRNGLQTLVQLMPTDVLRPAAVRRDWDLPHVEIADSPRFRWRGAHIDVSRHFMPVTWLRRFVELLALHKLNVMHLHLTDDQGWRLPSERWPRLTEVGSWRTGTRRGPRGQAGDDATPHGGHYTRQELVDLVAYAAARNVTVVPEIDLPGHMQAALTAYPELGNGTGPYEVLTTWGISEQVLNLDDATVTFCTDILGEVMDIFPSSYVHVGGDECPTTEWRHAPGAQARKRQLGLSDESGLQHWFTGQLHAYLTKAGRRLIGWDEIIDGGAPPEGATVMSWRGTRGGIAAARAGHDVVMCPETPCYFDQYQSDRADEPLAIGGLNTLEDVCAYDPVPAELEGDLARHVLGSQFQLWTEYMPTPAAVDYMAWPRGAALADVLWSPSGRDSIARRDRVASHLERLDVLGVGYRPLTGPLPWQRGGTGLRARATAD